MREKLYASCLSKLSSFFCFFLAVVFSAEEESRQFSYIFFPHCTIFIFFSQRSHPLLFHTSFFFSLSPFFALSIVFFTTPLGKDDINTRFFLPYQIGAHSHYCDRHLSSNIRSLFFSKPTHKTKTKPHKTETKYKNSFLPTFFTLEEKNRRFYLSKKNFCVFFPLFFFVKSFVSIFLLPSLFLLSKGIYKEP